MPARGVSGSTRNNQSFTNFGLFPRRFSILGCGSPKHSFIRVQLPNLISDSNRDIHRWLKCCWENENDDWSVFERGRRHLAGVQCIPSILSSDRSRWVHTPPWTWGCYYCQCRNISIFGEFSYCKSNLGRVPCVHSPSTSDMIWNWRTSLSYHTKTSLDHSNWVTLW
jgi:hypothetical protein